MADMRIGIIGAGGRMGQAVAREVAASADAALAAAADAPGGPVIGRDLGELAGIGPLGVAIGEDAEAVFAASDVVIEFTTPAATVAHAAIAGRTGIAHVVGTTGLEPAQEALLGEAALRAPVVHAPNMSLGVTVLFALARQVARLLDQSFDVEIVEMHHRHKVDAPSGTALGLGRAVAAGRGVVLDEVARFVRHGQTGPRGQGEIGFATLRGGNVVGDHSVIFAAEGERIELTHKAAGREIFARGAVRAALWAQAQPPGLYSMFDVLGLSAE